MSRARDGESPLARHTDWVKTTCPCCGGPATRETDTMPQWAGSSWYFLRYMDPHCKDALASKEALEYWSPVDWYNGGMEHTTLHLLYSRFWHKFLYDIGVVPTPEPYQKRTAHGMILGLNPHSFVNLPADEQEKLLEEYGSQKAAEKGTGREVRRDGPPSHRQDVQEPGQRYQPRRGGGPVRCRHHASV